MKYFQEKEVQTYMEHIYTIWSFKRKREKRKEKTKPLERPQ